MLVTIMNCVSCDAKIEMISIKGLIACYYYNYNCELWCARFTSRPPSPPPSPTEHIKTAFPVSIDRWAQMAVSVTPSSHLKKSYMICILIDTNLSTAWVLDQIKRNEWRGCPAVSASKLNRLRILWLKTYCFHITQIDDRPSAVGCLSIDYIEFLSTNDSPIRKLAHRFKTRHIFVRLKTYFKCVGGKAEP